MARVARCAWPRPQNACPSTKATQARLPAQTVACEQVLDTAQGLLVPSSSDRPGTYRYPGQGTSVLVLGDSFCRIYQFPEPQSLSELSSATAAG